MVPPAAGSSGQPPPTPSPAAPAAARMAPRRRGRAPGACRRPTARYDGHDRPIGDRLPGPRSRPRTATADPKWAWIHPFRLVLRTAQRARRCPCIRQDTHAVGQAPKVAVESVVGGVRDCGAGRALEATVPAGGTCPPVLLAGHACQCYWWSPGLLVIYSKGDDATGSATVRWVASVPGAADSAAKSRPRVKVRDVTPARAAVATACLAAAVRPNRTPLPL